MSIYRIMANISTGCPLVIGGTGGSGTRIVTQVANVAGFFMGSDTNASWDSLPIARFDWKNGRSLVSNEAFSDEISAEFRLAIADHLDDHDPQQAWGWKHPHSYLLLPFIRHHFPSMSFVHVIRDGRDIAIGKNQNQIRNYADLVFGPGEWTSMRSIQFWAWANNRAAEHGKNLLGDRYLRIRLEDLCVDPTSETIKLLNFIKCDDPVGIAKSAADYVQIPGSLGLGEKEFKMDTDTQNSVTETLKRFGYV